MIHLSEAVKLHFPRMLVSVNARLMLHSARQLGVRHGDAGFTAQPPEFRVRMGPRAGLRLTSALPG